MRLSTVLLAAGSGTRMKSSTPKVLHTIFNKPIIQYVVESILQFKAENNIVVIGPDSALVKNTLKGSPVTFAVQKMRLGTGDALKAATSKLKEFKGTILVLCGDTPLVCTATLQKLLRLHQSKKEDISIMSFIAEGPHAYGRIIRKNNRVEAIIEDKDAGPEQKRVREVNGGIYAIESHLLKLLNEIKINGKKGEYYLTDLVDIAVRRGHRVGAHLLGNETELTGINTRRELHNAGHHLRNRIIDVLIENGVSFIDTASAYIHPEAKIGADTIIYPNVYIEGRTTIGKNCTIYPNTRIIDSVIADNVVIKDSTVIEQSTVKSRAVIGPFAHIRPGSVIGPSSKIGNFVEIKKTLIGANTKASHLSYLGDAEIGENVNIGAGTITCNYDGKTKHKTIIEDNSFIGSDTQLVAPVRVSRGAYVGAGSTITKDVPPLSLAVSRTEQKHINNWAAKKMKEQKAKHKKK